MASEISWRGLATGQTDYVTIRSSGRQYWNTSGTPALENLTVANWTSYAIALTETPASSYFYVGTWPATLTTVGEYFLDVYRQAGGSAAIGDTLLGTLVGWWNGTTFDPMAGNMTAVNGTTQTARDIGATLGVAGAGLTNLGDTRLANLDETVSSRSTLAAGAQMDLVNAPNATAITAIQSGLVTTTLVTELQGLLGKNVGLRNTVYDSSTPPNLLSYDLCLYDSAAHATTNDGSTGLLHKYSVVNTYDAGNSLLTCVTTRIS